MTKGVSANLMQAGSKRRRTQKQIADEKAAELRKQQEVTTQLAELAEIARGCHEPMRKRPRMLGD